MYERMLDKSAIPTREDMSAWCGAVADDFAALNDWLSAAFATEQALAFPYGKKYGWAVAHRKKGKLVCNVFPEQEAFTVMLRLSDRQFRAAYDQLGDYARHYVDSRYPCGDGGWVHYRVTAPEHLADLRTLLTHKFIK